MLAWSLGPLAVVDASVARRDVTRAVGVGGDVVGRDGVRGCAWAMMRRRAICSENVAWF